MLRGYILVVTLAAASNAFAGAPTNAAHDLAQRFSGQVEKAAAPTDVKSATSVQAKPLNTGPTKPAQKEPAKSATAPTQVPVVKPFAKPAADQVVSQIATSERPSLDYEMDMLRRARAEQADRKSVEKPVPTAVPAKIVVTPPTTTPAPAITTGATPIAPPAPTPSAPKAAEPSQTAPTVPATAPEPTKSEPQKIVEAPVVTPPAAATATAPTPGVGAAAAQQPTEPAVQASVLLAIESETASSLDPIICIGDSCFVSAGLTADAVKVNKSDALKLKSSNDASPDACRGKVGCVFRNVGLAKNALIEVVEIGAPSSATVQSYAAHPDASCKSTGGALTCENPIATADFRIWIVPETIAKTAGVDAIEDAVADSLPHRDVSRDTDK